MKTNYNRFTVFLTFILSSLLAFTLAADCLAGELPYEDGAPKLLFWSSLYDCFDGGSVSEAKSAKETDNAYEADGESEKGTRPIIKFRVWETVKSIF